MKRLIGMSDPVPAGDGLSVSIELRLEGEPAIALQVRTADLAACTSAFVQAAAAAGAVRPTTEDPAAVPVLELQGSQLRAELMDNGELVMVLRVGTALALGQGLSRTQAATLGRTLLALSAQGRPN